jgi:hypothetical protein
LTFQRPRTTSTPTTGIHHIRLPAVAAKSGFATPIMLDYMLRTPSTAAAATEELHALE